MALHQEGDKPLPKAVMTKFNGAVYVARSSWVNED